MLNLLCLFLIFILFPIEFVKGMRVLITGTSKGIGLGLTRHLLAQPSITQVIATSRSESIELQNLKKSSEYAHKLVLLGLDVACSISQAQLSASLDSMGISSIDILINNHGISNPDHPNDSILTTTATDMANCFQTNCIGTLLTLQSQTPRLIASRAKLCVIVSSRLASIEQAFDLGGYTSYRCSKTAVNMLAAVYVKEPVVRDGGVRAMLVHPGWVQTDMGGAKGRKAPLSVDQSCTGLVERIFQGVEVQLNPQSHYSEGSLEAVLSNHRCVFVGYDGELLPF